MVGRKPLPPLRGPHAPPELVGSRAGSQEGRCYTITSVSSITVLRKPVRCYCAGRIVVGYNGSLKGGEE